MRPVIRSVPRWRRVKALLAVSARMPDGVERLRQIGTTRIPRRVRIASAGVAAPAATASTA